MTTNELLDLIGDAKDPYVRSAVNTREGVTVPHNQRPSFGKITLIAAVIAAILLLAGCTVAYVLNLQDKKIGETSGKKYFDEAGQRIPVTEVTRDVISLFGFSDSSVYGAAKAWYEFRQSYDPERNLFPYDESTWDFSTNYSNTYDCYTQEMVDKVDEIAEKYDLKLLGICATIQDSDTDIFWDAVGLDSLCVTDAPAKIRYGSGYLYPEGAFHLSVDIELTGEDSPWPHTVWSTVHYSPKGYFDPEYAFVDDTYEEWVYTTSDGTQVLIAMNSFGGLIFAEQPDAYLTVAIQTNTEWDIPAKEEQRPTQAAMEALAEVYDFSIRPQVRNMEETRQKLQASGDAWTAQYNAAMAEGAAPKYGNYADYLRNTYTRVRPLLRYAFYDLDGDGTEELLLCNQDGSFFEALTVTEAGVINTNLAGPIFLCENGVLEGDTAYDHFFSCTYFKVTGFSENGSDTTMLEHMDYDSFEEQWKYTTSWELGDTVISSEQAQAIRDKYPHLDLEIKSLMDYPLDDTGTTLEEVILANQVFTTEEQRMALYCEHAKKQEDQNAALRRRYYCLRDINGDGITDLLLGLETDHFRDAITVSNGELRAIEQWATMNLCENGILEISSSNTFADTYSFFRFESGEKVMIDYICYDAKREQWYRSNDGDYYYDETLTQEEAAAILDTYKQIDLEMKPISEFPGY